MRLTKMRTCKHGTEANKSNSVASTARPASRGGLGFAARPGPGPRSWPWAFIPRRPGNPAHSGRSRALCGRRWPAAGVAGEQLQGGRAAVLRPVAGPWPGCMGPAARGLGICMGPRGHGHQPTARGVRAGLACWLWARALLHVAGRPRQQNQGHGYAQCPILMATARGRHWAASFIRTGRGKGAEGRCWRWRRRVVLAESRQPAAGAAVYSPQAPSWGPQWSLN